MRRQHHRSTLASLATSKRVAVALCAAVAMVLGAMSVGATMHIYGGYTSVPQTYAAATADLEITATHPATKPSPTSQTKNPPEQTLTPILVASPAKITNDDLQKPTLVRPNIVSQTALTLGPLDVSASISSEKIQLDPKIIPLVTISVPATSTIINNPLPALTDPGKPTDSTSSTSTIPTQNAAPQSTQPQPTTSSTNSNPSTPPAQN